MNNEQYWQKRAKEREDKWLNKSKSEIETEIKNLYIRASDRRDRVRRD